MNTSNSDFQKSISSQLRAEFLKRKELNSRYSMRSFANLLNISPGALSDIMQEKRAVGLRTLERLKLSLNISSGSSFFKSEIGEDNYSALDEDQLSYIKEWYHYAIHDLLRTKTCDKSPSDIAEKLGITKLQTIDALSRLQRLALVKEHQGKWYAENTSFTTTNDIPSEALGYAFRQDLKNAARSLDEDSVAERDFSSITFTFKNEQMAEAKRVLKQFRRDFYKQFDLPDGEGEQVYQLNISLIPLSKNKSGEE